jgi:shikimate 5-dehydrogenase
MSDRSKRLSRRNFLLTIGAGGAATAAAAVAKQSATPTAQAEHSNKRATRGYQASAHVHNYYRTTKV